MPKFEIAHINEQGQDIIIVPLNSSFDALPDDEKKKTIVELQKRSTGARLKGKVVPVWVDTLGGFCFICPSPWHPYFSGLNMDIVQSMINKSLSW
jgi:hypothetical protein